MASERPVAASEILKHSSRDDCWIVVDNQVWDITSFAGEHPGGPSGRSKLIRCLGIHLIDFPVIYRHAGRDASESFNSIHSYSLLPESLPPTAHIGQLDTSDVPEDLAKPPPTATPELAINEKPPLHTIISAYDFEEVARRTYSPKAWAFYSSAATDLITTHANRECLDSIMFRPRLMRNVLNVSTRSKILGNDVSIPLFISPAALVKLAHPDGEKAMARACVAQGIIQCISNNASFTTADIVKETPESQPSIFQLYMNRDRAKARETLEQIMALRPRIRAIMVTIDAPVPGKREADERLKADVTISSVNSGTKAGDDNRGSGVARTMGSYIDPSLSWSDIPWIRSIVGDMPIFIKGVQTAADAKLALQAGVQGILVSNHGGRSLDGSPPAVIALLELHRFAPQVFGRLEVWVDGAVRRGTDVLKLLCLGASAVGVGRAALYSVNYGQEGVERLVEILRDEMEIGMRLIGVNGVEGCWPGLVNTGRVDSWVPQVEEGGGYVQWPRPPEERGREKARL